MKKRIISVVVALGIILSFAGCKKKDTKKETRIKKTRTTSVSETEEPETEDTEPSVSETVDPNAVKFDESTFPFIYCSDELQQLGIALSSSMLGISAKDAGTFFLSTLRERTNIYAEDPDLAFCTPDLKGRLDQYDTIYEDKVIAQDAIALFVSKSNPVDSLTSEQVRKIYLGEITNWKEVGGKDEPIVPFARENSSTSNKLFTNIVLGQAIPDTTNVPMVEAEGDDYCTFLTPRMFDNTAGAIGFTQYYYAQECFFSDKVKILAIDDVALSSDTIRSGAYPFLFDLYALISVDLSADSAERVIYDYLTTEDGKKVIEKAGYVASADTTASSKNVVCDLDSYDPGEKPQEVYTRASDEPILEFVPGDYSEIYPFLGSYMSGSFGNRQNLYGFIDAQGKIICDPIFTYPTRLKDGMYAVTRYDKKPEGQVGIIGKNGAFYTDTLYDHLYTLDGVLTFINVEQNGLQLFTFDENSGNVEKGAFLKMNDTDAMYCCSTIIDSRYIICENEVDEEYYIFDGMTGEDIREKLFGDKRFWRYGEIFEVLKDNPTSRDTCEKVIDIEGKVLFDDPDSELHYISSKLFWYGSIDGDEMKILSREGKVLATISNKEHDVEDFRASDDYLVVERKRMYEVYDLQNMQLLALADIFEDEYAYPMEKPLDYYGDPLGEGKNEPIFVSSNGSTAQIRNMNTDKMVTFSTNDFTFCYQMNGTVIKTDRETWMIMDSSDFHVIAEGTGFTELYMDNVTQKYYMTIRNSILNSSLQIIDVATGEVVLEDLPNPRNDRMEIRSINDGRIYYETQYPNDELFGTPSGCTIVDMDGNVLFRYNGLAFIRDYN